MATFKVFRHPELGFEVVKQGVSWPGFFFHVIWMMVKNLWRAAGFWSLAAMTLLILEHLAEPVRNGGAKTALLLLIAAGWFVLGFLPLWKGNEWREADLRARQYRLVATVQAATPEAAKAQVEDAPAAVSPQDA